VRQSGEELVFHAVDAFGFAPCVLFAEQEIRALGFRSSALGDDGPQPLIRPGELLRPLANPQVERVMGAAEVLGLALERV
jgi:hypothetical protein